jgi:hypothetical protein
VVIFQNRLELKGRRRKQDLRRQFWIDVHS